MMPLLGIPKLIRSKELGCIRAKGKCPVDSCLSVLQLARVVVCVWPVKSGAVYESIRPNSGTVGWQTDC